MQLGLKILPLYSRSHWPLSSINTQDVIPGLLIVPPGGLFRVVIVNTLHKNLRVSDECFANINEEKTYQFEQCVTGYTIEHL
jgi:hypothetical protein